MFRRLFVIAFLLFPSHSYAQDEKAHLDVLCNHVKNAQTPSQGADYVAGVDVHGKSVKPADLSQNEANIINNPVIIPIELDLVQRYGLNLPNGIELEPTLGHIQIYENGNIKYNEKNISQDIIKLCERYEAENKKNQPNQTEQHGHESSNPVLSSADKSDKIEGQFPPRKPKETQKSPRYNE